MGTRISLLIAGISLVLEPLWAATFVVPPDRELVGKATAIVVASALASHTEMDSEGEITTVTTLSLEEIIKGQIEGSNFQIREPGGVFGNQATFLPGVPRFADGERNILFLRRDDGEWHVLDLALGKFQFETDILGRSVVARQASEIHGWDPDGSVHREQVRDAEAFLGFLRGVARGAPVRDDYFIPAEPLIGGPSLSSPRKHLLPMVNATFSATSYTFPISGSMGGRWNVFPSGVNFFSVGTEPGAPGNGITAINAAFSAWNGDPSSNVSYVYAGADNGTHNKGLSGKDDANTVMFERDLSSRGIPPFVCTSNSYSGTLGVGGITVADASVQGRHGPNGELFATTLEADVEMNRGIANCTLLFNNGDFNTAVAHEVGHTLGFRHSDQNRPGSASCASDPSLECATTAIMKSFVPNGINATLQPWDQHAVTAVYPGSGGGSVPAVPSGVTATAQATNRVLVTWNAVSGATSYEIFRRAPGGGFVSIGTSTSTSFTDTGVAANTAYLYRVHARNAAGSSGASASDLTTTVIFTDDPLIAGSTRIRAVHLAELRTAVNAVRTLAGLGTFSFTDSATPGVVVKAIHITQLRSALDQAMSALGLTTGGWTGTISAGVVIRAIHFQEIRDRVK